MAGEIFERLLSASGNSGDAGALRIRASYAPTGGPSTKVFPPTYPGSEKYLVESRYLEGALVRAIVLDSIQSQANRLELGILDAVDDGRVALPFLEVAADIASEPFRVTSLDAPHRSPDAYFRDAETADGIPFDESELGRTLRRSSERVATPLFQHSPADLVLGMWDSQRGGRGRRIARAYSSEVVGFGVERGQRGAVRMDPYNLQGSIQYNKETREWALESSGSVRGAKKAKLSDVNHGNAIADESVGGFAVAAIERVATVSFGVLRRLRFPLGGEHSAERDAAGRAVLASLALLGDRLAFAGPSLFLRSGCDLALQNETVEWVLRGGASDMLEMDVPAAFDLFTTAVQHASSFGLRFAAEPVRLRPKKNLRELLEQNFTRPPATDD